MTATEEMRLLDGSGLISGIDECVHEARILLDSNPIKAQTFDTVCVLQRAWGTLDRLAIFCQIFDAECPERVKHVVDEEWEQWKQWKQWNKAKGR